MGPSRPAETARNDGRPSGSRFKSAVVAGTRIPSDECKFFLDARNRHVVTGRVSSGSGGWTVSAGEKADTEGGGCSALTTGFPAWTEGETGKTWQTLRKKMGRGFRIEDDALKIYVYCCL